MATNHPPLRFFGEALGLSPWRERYRQAMVAIRGQQDVPPSRFDLSSLRLLRPRVAMPLWRGRPFIERKVILTNLFNHRQTPVENGWSVKQTQVEDFRGRGLTYDSHNGTDLSIPVGTRVLTTAPGEVVSIVSEFNRGGLKIFIDHGDGLMTCSAHLARALVTEGQVLGRGEAIALSGYSGLDGFVTFPFGVPHIHLNTWLDGVPVDPFPRGADESLWRGGALPTPVGRQDQADQEANEDDEGGPTQFSPSTYSETRVDDAIAACRTESTRARLAAIEPLSARAARTIIEMNYYPTRFTSRVRVYEGEHRREPRLDLPFSRRDFDGVVFVDELGR
ncbi:MAG: M23 family metallopeptidase [Deltaproteobacteria bacterium]|nr:M23 family metallopeptidase [Deltaproteobacteria bacterium]